MRRDEPNSGFMIAQVTAAALVAENRGLAVPRSTDGLPTSANHEDHVSMATGAALRLHEMAENLAAIRSIALLANAQGLEFHRPLQSSAVVERAHGLVRGVAGPWHADRVMAPDIAAVKGLVERGRFAALVEAP